MYARRSPTSRGPRNPPLPTPPRPPPPPPPALGVLSNPAYAGAYVYGRFRSRRLVSPDGTIRTTTVELPRSQWAVVLHDHHPGYIDWETFLRNEARLQRNRTNAGERPPREGEALLQGILVCGGCGRQMSTRYPAGRGYYECAKSRADHVETPRCRSVALGHAR